MTHSIYITLESELSKEETYNKAIVAFDNYDRLVAQLTKAREELLLLSEEANYTSVRWQKEHIAPIDKLLKEIAL